MHGKSSDGEVTPLLPPERRANPRYSPDPLVPVFFAHPEAKYFAVGKLGRDQVEDYARRKGMEVTDTERWLGPWLNYDP